MKRLYSEIHGPIATYKITLDQKIDDFDLSQTLINEFSHELASQVVIASPQNISLSSVMQKYFNLPKTTFKWAEYATLDVAYINYLIRKWRGKTPYGGFILFDYNIGNFTLEEYKSFNEDLRKAYTIRFVFSFKGQSSRQIIAEIEPWIVADCDVNLTKVSYCRNFAVNSLIEDQTLPIIYNSLGLNSPLSPSVDQIDIATNCSQDSPLLATKVAEMVEHKQLPILKHFLYDMSVDTHIGSYRDDRTLNEIQEASKCYAEIDKLGIPFGIMPSHFYLTEIDNENILTKSDALQEYELSNFPNAVTIADEFSMKGYSNTEGFAERVASSSTDMLLVHGGSLRFWKRLHIQSGIKKIDNSTIQTRLSRILNLKDYYGLIKVWVIDQNSSN